jgi:hypothetical protein
MCSVLSSVKRYKRKGALIYKLISAKRNIKTATKLALGVVFKRLQATEIKGLLTPLATACGGIKHAKLNRPFPHS